MENKKPSETINKKQKKFTDDYSPKVDILSEPFKNLLESKTIEFIIEELDRLHDNLTNPYN